LFIALGKLSISLLDIVKRCAIPVILWLQAVELWNSVSEQLQEVVSACMEADLEEVSHEDATQQHFILSTDEDRLLDDAEVGSCERCMSGPGGGL
jgi:hypothetical protein